MKKIAKRRDSNRDVTGYVRDHVDNWITDNDHKVGCKVTSNNVLSVREAMM